jgi:glutamate-1-semialdehyde 2,1-aminomutase
MVTLERSRQLYEAMRTIVPGGVHSNFRYQEPHPLYFARAEGARIWDVDGNEYIDCVINNGALILGHRHPRVVEAVKAQLENGLTAAVESELSYRVSKLMVEMIPGAEMVRFSNTGTEAIMKALMVARAYTGKEWIIKAEGCYHGWYEQVAVSEFPPLDQAGPPEEPQPVPETQGLLQGVEERVVVVPYNDPEALERAVKRNRDRVAALLLEPVAHNMGTVPPREGYLERARELTEQYGILLVFDEVISGFRAAPGGAQEYFGIKPDLSVFAKAIANGFPLSALTGIREVMEITTPRTGRVAYAGTYNGHQIALAAAEATLLELRDGRVAEYLHRTTRQLVEGFNKIARDLGVAARLQGFAGKFHAYFTDREVYNYRDAQTSDEAAYRTFRDTLLEQGVYFNPSKIFHHGVTYAHTSSDIEAILAGFEAALRAVAAK